jgi:antitoxin (DNA-binding transcriptional repressor) of toxin-antitoxin stability system
MTNININEAKTHLSRYAKRVKAGETIILCDRNKPFAEIRPLKAKVPVKPRKLGQFKGTVIDMESFNSADSEIENDFLESQIFLKSE